MIPAAVNMIAPATAKAEVFGPAVLAALTTVVVSINRSSYIFISF